MLAVDLRSLTKRFGPVTAVNDLSLQIESGEVVAFLGPNGAGKTTTIDMLLGLAQPDAGTVRLYGTTPEDAIARGDVSAVMQNGGLLKDFTVEETVAYTASLYSHAKPVDEVLDRAGIAAIADRRVAKCSGGEQQRLRFAMALLSIRGCSCSMNRPREWTWRRVALSGARFARTPSVGGRSCSRRITSTRLTRTPIASCSFVRGPWSPTARRPRSRTSRRAGWSAPRSPTPTSARSAR